MDLTLGTLAELKAHLLNSALQSDTTYDGALAALGRGVAGRMHAVCNRIFPRAVADTFEFQADRYHVVLPRYPVEVITKLELRQTLAEGWIDQGTPSTYITQLSEESGLVEFTIPEFGIRYGLPGMRGRITYTGGYWIDLSGDGSADLGSRSYQDGTVALTAGAESLAVVFPTAFGGAPTVNVTVIPPPGGSIIPGVPSVITASGFTALLGFPIPATGYSLQWTAASPAAATPVPSSTQPSGSTARPDDLYYAWLLQCERTWGLIDKLGISIGQKEATTALAGLELVPEVKEILRTYTRHALT
jgi:hypothetical protein